MDIVLTLLSVLVVLLGVYMAGWKTSEVLYKRRTTVLARCDVGVGIGRDFSSYDSRLAEPGRMDKALIMQEIVNAMDGEMLAEFVLAGGLVGFPNVYVPIEKVPHILTAVSCRVLDKALDESAHSLKLKICAFCAHDENPTEETCGVCMHASVENDQNMYQPKTRSSNEPGY